MFAIAAVMLVLLSVSAVAGAFAGNSSGGVYAERVALAAQEAAQISAGDHHGSYVRVGLLQLRKTGGVPITPSAHGAWVSSVRSSRAGFSVTVTDGPSRDTFTITRASDGTVTRTCQVSHFALGACHNLNAAGAGTW